MSQKCQNQNYPQRDSTYDVLVHEKGQMLTVTDIERKLRQLREVLLEPVTDHHKCLISELEKMIFKEDIISVASKGINKFLEDDDLNTVNGLQFLMQLYHIVALADKRHAFSEFDSPFDSIRYKIGSKIETQNNFEKLKINAKEYIKIKSDGLSPQHFYFCISNVWHLLPKIHFLIKHMYLWELLHKKQCVTFKEFVASDTEYYLKFYRKTERQTFDTILMKVLHSAVFLQLESTNIMRTISSWEEFISLGFYTVICRDINLPELKASEVHDSLHCIWELFPDLEWIINREYFDEYLLGNHNYILKHWIYRFIINFLCSAFFPKMASVIEMMRAYHIFSQEKHDKYEEIGNSFLSKLKKQSISDDEITYYIERNCQGISIADLCDVLHQVWKHWPEMEVEIKLRYCQQLVENNNYQSYRDIIYLDASLFLHHSGLTGDCKTVIPHIIALLHYLSQPESPSCEIRTELILLQLTHLFQEKDISMKTIHLYFETNKIFDQSFSCTHVEKLLHCKENHSKSEMKTIVDYLVCLVEIDLTDNVLQLLKCNPKLLTFTNKNLTEYFNCKMKRDYIILLLRLLHEFDKNKDSYGIVITMKTIFDFKGCLHNANGDYSLQLLWSVIINDYGSVHESLIEMKNDINVFEWLQSELKKIIKSNLKNTSVSLSKDNCDFDCEILDESLLFNRPNTPSKIIAQRTSLSSYEHLTSDKEDAIVTAIVEELNMKYFNKNLVVLAKMTLDIVKTVTKCSILSKLVLSIGKLVGVKDNATENDVIYKLFCMVRQAQKNGGHLNIDINEYKAHFSFIDLMDKEEGVQQTLAKFLVFLIVLLVYFTNCQHHKSAELKKYLSLKYAYDDAILYLLWCSGDVEINPGPSFSKPKPLPESQRLRYWINAMCSKLLKFLDASWKKPPRTWPKDQRLTDPRNKSRDYKDASLSNENLLDCLIECCNNEDIEISPCHQKEIDAYKNKNFPLLFELYISREKLDETARSTQYLLKYKNSPLLKNRLSDIQVEINFDGVTSEENLPYKCKAEIVRDLAVMFCKLCKGLHPHEKKDGIWSHPPVGWNKENPFFSPHNTKKRQEKGQDEKLLDNLYEYYEKHMLPSDYVERHKHIVFDCDALYKALKQNEKDLKELYIVHANTAAINYCLKHLETEGHLQKQSTVNRLKEIGITVTTAQLESKVDSCNAGVPESMCPTNSQRRPKKRKQTENDNYRTKKKKTQKVLETNKLDIASQIDSNNLPRNNTLVLTDEHLKETPESPLPLNIATSDTTIGKADTSNAIGSEDDQSERSAQSREYNGANDDLTCIVTPSDDIGIRHDQPSIQTQELPDIDVFNNIGLITNETFEDNELNVLDCLKSLIESWPSEDMY